MYEVYFVHNEVYKAGSYDLYNWSDFLKEGSLITQNSESPPREIYF